MRSATHRTKDLHAVALKTKIAIAAMGAAMLASVKIYADAEYGFARIKTLLRGQEELFGRLERQGRELAATVGVRTADAYNAMWQAISGGIAPMKAAEFAHAALQAKIAGGIENVDLAAKAMLQVMNAYKQQNLSATHVTDLFFQTVAKGLTNFQELSQHIGQAASAMAQYKIPVEEFFAAIAAGTQVSGDAGKTVIGLRALLKSLSAHYGAAKLASLGLLGALQELQKETGGNMDALRKILTEERAFTAALQVGRDGAIHYKKALEDMNAATGASADAHKVMSETLVEQWKVVKNGLLALAEAFGEKLTPAIKTLMDAVKYTVAWIQKWGKVGKALLEWVTIMTIALVAYKAILIGIAAVKAFIVGMSGALVLVAAAATAAIAVFITLTSATKNTGDAAKDAAKGTDILSMALSGIIPVSRNAEKAVNNLAEAVRNFGRAKHKIAQEKIFANIAEDLEKNIAGIEGLVRETNEKSKRRRKLELDIIPALSEELDIYENAQESLSWAAKNYTEGLMRDIEKAKAALRQAQQESREIKKWFEAGQGLHESGAQERIEKLKQEADALKERWLALTKTKKIQDEILRDREKSGRILSDLFNTQQRLGKSELELLEMDLRRLHVSEKIIQYALKTKEAITEETKALEDKAYILNTLKKLEEEARTVGMAAEEKQLEMLREKGANKRQLFDAKNAMEWIKHSKQAADVIAENMRRTEAALSPLQKYEKIVGDLNVLVKAGALEWDEYKKRIRFAREDLEAASEVDFPKTAEAKVVNTALMDLRGLTENFGIDPNYEDKAQTELLKKIQKILERILGKAKAAELA